jgi:hypothetical protein
MKLEKTVYDVVVATVADYGRMKKMLDKGNLSKNQAIEITRKLDAVDNALMTVCDGEAEEAIEALRYDIAHRNGFEYATSKGFYTSRGTYDKRKSDAVVLIAKLMSLI